jgi:hypothetical protein
VTTPGKEQEMSEVERTLLAAIDALIDAVNHPHGINAVALQEAVNHADDARALLKDGERDAL